MRKVLFHPHPLQPQRIRPHLPQYRFRRVRGPTYSPPLSPTPLPDRQLPPIHLPFAVSGNSSNNTTTIGTCIPAASSPLLPQPCRRQLRSLLPHQHTPPTACLRSPSPTRSRRSFTPDCSRNAASTSPTRSGIPGSSPARPSPQTRSSPLCATSPGLRFDTSALRVLNKRIGNKPLRRHLRPVQVPARNSCSPMYSSPPLQPVLLPPARLICRFVCSRSPVRYVRNGSRCSLPPRLNKSSFPSARIRLHTTSTAVWAKMFSTIPRFSGSPPDFTTRTVSGTPFASSSALIAEAPY